MNDTPLYTSKRLGRNLWQQYRIFPDRLELQSWICLRTLVIPARAIQALEVRPSIFGGRKGFVWGIKISGRKGFAWGIKISGRKRFVWGIKIDLCDLFRHVLLVRTSGLSRCIGFTPDDPEKFARAWQIMRRAM